VLPGETVAEYKGYLKTAWQVLTAWKLRFQVAFWFSAIWLSAMAGQCRRTLLAHIHFTIGRIYSGLTKIRIRRRAADNTHVTARRANAVLVFVNSL